MRRVSTTDLKQRKAQIVFLHIRAHLLLACRTHAVNSAYVHAMNTALHAYINELKQVCN